MDATYFAVVRIVDGKVMYKGKLDYKAAAALEPGTVHGSGTSESEAVSKARDVADGHRIR